METPPSKYFLPLGDKMENSMRDYFSEKKIAIREKLNRRNKKINTEDLSYRILNHWEKNGLLEVERGEGGTGWRKFSIMDSVWISLISELRSFGVSIENIKHVKDQLVNSTEEDILPSIYPLLEFYTAYFLSSRMPISIMVFDDFKILIGTQAQVDIATKFNMIGNHIRISLPAIVQDIFKDKNLSVVHKESINLTDKELELIVEIRTGAYKSIMVKMKNGEMITMEKEKDDHNVVKKLYQILQEKKYDRIVIDRENGDIKNITHILKKKF